jgi:hypothetical protein
MAVHTIQMNALEAFGKKEQKFPIVCFGHVRRSVAFPRRNRFPCIIDVIVRDHKNPHRLKVAFPEFSTVAIDIKMKMGMLGTECSVLIS